MFISAFYLIAFNPGGLLCTLLYIVCSYVLFFECRCSLLWTLGGTGRNESLFYIVKLYLSYYSSKSSLNQWSWLLVIITLHLKRSRIATFSTRRDRVTIGDGIIKHCENLTDLVIIAINYSSFCEETPAELAGFFYLHIQYYTKLIISVLLVFYIWHPKGVAGGFTLLPQLVWW